MPRRFGTTRSACCASPQVLLIKAFFLRRSAPAGRRYPLHAPAQENVPGRDHGRLSDAGHAACQQLRWLWPCSLAPDQVRKQPATPCCFGLVIRGAGQARLAIEDEGFERVVEAEAAVLVRYFRVVRAEGGGHGRDRLGATRQRQDARVEGGHIGFEVRRGVPLRVDRDKQHLEAIAVWA